MDPEINQIIMGPGRNVTTSNWMIIDANSDGGLFHSGLDLRTRTFPGGDSRGQ